MNLTPLLHQLSFDLAKAEIVVADPLVELG